MVKQDEAANPLYVGFFGPVGVMFESDDISHLIQQFRRALLHEEVEDVYGVLNSTITHLRSESENMRKDSAQTPPAAYYAERFDLNGELGH